MRIYWEVKNSSDFMGSGCWNLSVLWGGNSEKPKNNGMHVLPSVFFFYYSLTNFLKHTPTYTGIYFGLWSGQWTLYNNYHKIGLELFWTFCMFIGWWKLCSLSIFKEYQTEVLFFEFSLEGTLWPPVCEGRWWRGAICCHFLGLF